MLHGFQADVSCKMCFTGGKHDEPMDGRTDFGVGDLRHQGLQGRAGWAGRRWNLVELGGASKE